MKRSMFRLPKVCVAIFAITVFVGSAIGQDPLPFNYRVEYAEASIELPAGLEGLSIEGIVQVNDGINDGLYVAGTYSLVGGDNRGFIYHYENSEFIDMPTLVGLADPDFIRCACYDMNESGIVVAAIRDAANLVHAVYFDLFESGTPQVHSLNDQFSEIPIGRLPYRINSVGDILMDQGGVVVNPFLNVAYQTPGANEFDFGKDINDLGTVLLRTSQTEGGIRSNIHDSNSAEYFPGFNFIGASGINNFDEFCARQDFDFGKGPPSARYKQFALRYSSQVDWYSDPFEVLATDSINDSGDICGEVKGFGNPDGYLHYSSGTAIETGPTLSLQSLITDEFFVAGTLWQFKISNRIELSPTVSAPIVCGLITDRNADRRIFFLIPEIPPPSISVNDVTIDEGNDGTTTPGSFTFTLSELTGQDVTLFFQIVDGSATAGEDYTAPVSSGLLTFDFAASEMSKTVDFTIIGDNTSEGDETFSIQLSDAFGGATIAKDNGTATIKNDDTKGGGKKK